MFNDLFKYSNVGFFLAGIELKAKYRRSALGSLWYSLSTLVAILGIGPIYSVIFNIDINEYYVFISVSIVIWGFISSILGESPSTFYQNEGYIKDVGIHPISLSFLLLYKNLFILIQNLLVLYLVFIIFNFESKFNLIHGVPALVTLCLIAIPCSILFGILGARFRDVANIVSSLLTLLFFITPVLWKPGTNINLDSPYLRFNPFYYAIQVPRIAIIEGIFFPKDFIILLLILFFISLLSFLFFKRYKKMIGFWI